MSVDLAPSVGSQPELGPASHVQDPNGQGVYGAGSRRPIVAVWSDSPYPCTYYRCTLPLRALQRTGERLDG